MSKLQSPPGTPSTGKKLIWLVTLAVLSAPLTVYCASLDDDTDVTEAEPESQLIDMRSYVEIPEKARRILQEDMLDHLAVLNEINGYLADNDLPAAAEVAETGMGRSLLSKYQDEEMRPGRYMPKEMREIGWELHNAAAQFVSAARQGNLQKTLLAYQRITSACVSCHYSYRTR
jgi:hypothetical protein